VSDGIYLQSPSHVTAAPNPAWVSAGAPASPANPADGLGLSAATALVVGSIVGVGIFNLPTSLAAFGPIGLISMGADDYRRDRPRDALRRAVAAHAG
jgi:hypothetical protein